LSAAKASTTIEKLVVEIPDPEVDPLIPQPEDVQDGIVEWDA
jgi:hypothetical protein